MLSNLYIINFTTFTNFRTIHTQRCYNTPLFYWRSIRCYFVVTKIYFNNSLCVKSLLILFWKLKFLSEFLCNGIFVWVNTTVSSMAFPTRYGWITGSVVCPMMEFDSRLSFCFFLRRQLLTFVGKFSQNFFVIPVEIQSLFSQHNFKKIFLSCYIPAASRSYDSAVPPEAFIDIFFFQKRYKICLFCPARHIEVAAQLAWCWSITQFTTFWLVHRFPSQINGITSATQAWSGAFNQIMCSDFFFILFLRF